MSVLPLLCLSIGLLSFPEPASAGAGDVRGRGVKGVAVTVTVTVFVLCAMCTVFIQNLSRFFLNIET